MYGRSSSHQHAQSVMREDPFAANLRTLHLATTGKAHQMLTRTRKHLCCFTEGYDEQG